MATVVGGKSSNFNGRGASAVPQAAPASVPRVVAGQCRFSLMLVSFFTHRARDNHKSVAFPYDFGLPLVGGDGKASSHSISRISGNSNNVAFVSSSFER